MIIQINTIPRHSLLPQILFPRPFDYTLTSPFDHQIEGCDRMYQTEMSVCNKKDMVILITNIINNNKPDEMKAKIINKINL